MGASGSAWIKPKKRKGLRSDSLTNVPHPLFARAGQRFFPLASRAANAMTMRVLRVTDTHCELRREDHEARTVRVTIARLLAVDGDGRGRYYRFIGFAQRTGYQTQAVVVEVEEHWTRLVFPEWNPDVTVAVATGSLPREVRRAGAWVDCKADLSADAGARVAPRGFAPVGPGFDPALHHPVEVVAAPVAAARPAPALGEGCGDVVLFLAQDRLTESIEAGSLYVTGHPPPVKRGGRAYMHAAGSVQGWREVDAVHKLPNGNRVVFAGAWQPATLDVEVRLPSSGVAGGQHGRQLWAWRSWPREG